MKTKNLIIKNNLRIGVLSSVFFTLHVSLFAVTLTGEIKEKGTGKAISDATVINNEDRQKYVNVDEQGHFQIDVPDFTKSILIRSDNYYDSNILVQDFFLDHKHHIYYLERLPDIVGSGIIRAKKKQEISQTNLSQNELRYTAGAGGDAVKSIQTLPSVAPAQVGSANIVVRGSDQNDNKYFYDDLELPFVFHFGGVNTVIPTRMIDSVDFYPGAFSALYGNAMGGIIQLNSKNEVPNHFSGDVEAGLFQSGIYLEGNILAKKFDNKAINESKNLTQTKNVDDEGIGYRLGLRRTYYELYAPIINKAADIDFFTFPQSTDYQFVLDGKAKGATWQLYLLGASDRLGLLGNEGASLDSSGKNSFNYFSYFETAGARYTKNLGNGYGLSLNLQQLYNTFNINFADSNLEADAYVYSLKTAVTKNFNESNFLTIGIVPKYEIDKIYLNIYQLPPPGSSTQSFDPFTAPRVKTSQTIKNPYGEGFLDFNFKPVAKWLVNPGIHFLKGPRSRQFAADPRFGSRYEFLEGNTLKLAIGYYSERPQVQYDAPKYGNENLELERSTQYVLGYESKIFSDWSIDIQGWQKQSNNLVGAAVSNPLNKYENSVKFKAQGVDFFIKKNFLGRYYGWFSYGYAKSEKQDPVSGVWRFSNNDRTHNLNLVANAKVTNRWLLGTRIHYMSGAPHSAILGGVYNQNTGQYVPASDGQNYLISKNDGRYSAFFQMDVRSDYDFLFDTWKLDLYLEIDNITNQKNISQVSYNRDYTRQLNVYSFPILPSLGVIASF